MSSAHAGATGGLGSGVGDRRAALPADRRDHRLGDLVLAHHHLVAPCFFRCSISSSECARAMIGSDGLRLRACVDRSGRPRTHRESRPAGSAPPRKFAAGDAHRVGGIAGDGLDALALEPRQRGRHRPRSPAAACRASSSRSLTKLPTRPWPTSTTWSVQCRRAESPSAPASAARRAASGVAGLRSRPRQKAVEHREEQRIEQDRDDRAGEDQIAAALGQQRQRHAEPGEDEGELADLREARRNRQRGRVRIAGTAARSHRRRSTCRAR